jgi:2-polyprenyl-3-methyl-5-hydroxy-6-metoxy-1,4-benzoquinol methylase
VSGDDRQSLVDFNESVFANRVFEPRESRLRKALASFEREANRGELLDVAAGSGLAAEALAAQGWTVTALDLSSELVSQIRARPGVHRALQHDLSSGSLPFDDAVMAAVFAGEIIEHLVDTRRFLDEIHRVLRPGGLLVVTTPNLASFENRVRLLFGVYPAWLEYELSSQGHVRAYTKRTLRTHLRSTGFSIERVTGNWVPFVPQALLHDVRWPALAHTGEWLPGLSQGLIATARRT